MKKEKRKHPKIKTRLHPRNKHRERYNFKELINTCPDLARFVKLNIYDDESVDFFDPEAVKMLNTALLKHYYKIDHWNIPENYLFPPIPGRADYIHHVADLLATSNYGRIPTGNDIKCLDIGVGANCIYPIIGTKEYGWDFVGTDIDPVSIEAAGETVKLNSTLKGKIELRLQPISKDIFTGIVKKDEIFDLSICNPPFHSSFKEAQSATIRKSKNLNHYNNPAPTRNFGGQSNELWTEGGEEKFVRDMVYQSKQFSRSFYWFSTVISKQSHLKRVYEILNSAHALDVRTIPMGQGNKSSRIVAWTFLNKLQQKEWVSSRWRPPVKKDTPE